MTSLNDFFVDPISCRNFNLTHKKVFIYFPETRQFIPILKNMLV